MKPFELCVVKLSSLGDVLQVAYVIRHLKKSGFSLSITWIIDLKCLELLSSLNVADHIIPFESAALKKSSLKAMQEILNLNAALKKRRFDCVIDFQGNSKSALVTFLCRAKSKLGFDRASVAEFPNLFFTNSKVAINPKDSIVKQYFTLLSKVFQGLPQLVQEDKPFNLCLRIVMVCFGSNWENKKLSLHQLKAFLNKIHKTYGVEFWFVVGSKEDAEDAKLVISELQAKMKIFEKPSWTAWIEVMQRVDIVISSDSCALHLAGFLDVPTFSYFGPSKELVYKPFGNFHHSIQGGCPYGQNFIKRCTKLRTCSTGACLKNINPQDLFQKFILKFDQNSSAAP